MANQNLEEILITFNKSVFSNVPYVGQLLNEVFFEYGGRKKQNRLNEFTELLRNYFEEAGGIEIDNIVTDNLSDVFESVFRKVVQTSSKEKHILFRNIIVNQIRKPDLNSDHTDTFLDFVSKLTQIEVAILQAHREFSEEYLTTKNAIGTLDAEIRNKELELKNEQDLSDKGYANNHSLKSSELQELRKLSKKQTELLNRIKDFRSHNYYDIAETDFLFYKQNLISNGLLVETEINSFNYVPFQTMLITEVGKRFINYILLSK